MSSTYTPSYLHASEAHRDSTASASSTSSVKNAMKAVARRYKEHNESVQNAFETYYGVGSHGYPSARTTPAPSRNVSVGSTSSNESASSPSGMKKAWTAIKKHAAEHHASVSNAHSALYGSPRIYQQTAAEVKTFDQAYKN